MGSIVKRRILQNFPGQGWYWEIVAGHEVMARGLADTHEEACSQAAEAKRQRQAERMHLYGDAIRGISKHH